MNLKKALAMDGIGSLVKDMTPEEQQELMERIAKMKAVEVKIPLTPKQVKARAKEKRARVARKINWNK